MVGLNDAASERISARYLSDHQAQVEAVRVGTIIAHDRKALARYRSMNRAPQQLSDQALEQAIANVARLFPGNVLHEARS